MQYENSRLADYTEEKEGTGGVDLPFALLVVLLLTVGVIMVLSASFASAYYELGNETGGNPTYYFARQLVFAAGGVGVMFLCSKFPPSFYRRISGIVMLTALGTLLAVLVIGSKVNGARRWIDLGFTTFQPSEIAKIAVILYFSALICRYKDRMRSFRHGILPFAGILLLIVALLVAEPHLSASIIILAIGAVMLFIGGARLYWFVGGATLLGAVAFVVVRFFPYASARITTWRDPFSDLTGNGWQIVQSLYAIGSGGLMGLGLGQSRQKYLYLPEEHNDFIFSVLSEELGLIGAILVLTLFALLIVRGYWLAMHARDRYGFLVGTGITTLLALQVFLNVAVCTNLIPATGISLPFFSYGGTALLIQMAEMGVMLSISRDIPARK
jgi:cell division protein FtsW